MDKSNYLTAMGIEEWAPRQSAQAHSQEESLPNEQVLEDDWLTLQEKVKTCTLCKLHRNRTHAVFGVGNPQADLMIIGEAPGAQEDRQGEPFVGKAGQLLNNMLAAIQLTREEIFIVNILKCRPPNNRDPEPEEVAQCTPYLKAQLAHVKPRLILAVGRIAANFLLQQKTSLSRLRGHQFNYGDNHIPLFITYHPAYLLRKPSDKVKAYEDLLQVKSFMQSAIKSSQT